MTTEITVFFTEYVSKALCGTIFNLAGIYIYICVCVHMALLRSSVIGSINKHNISKAEGFLRSPMELGILELFLCCYLSMLILHQTLASHQEPSILSK